METVLVGAPGSGARIVAKSLADHHHARFVDLTGDPARRPDAISGVRLSDSADAGPTLRRVIAADRVVADTTIRSRLYRGRHVVWLDVPADRLVERLRSARRADVEIDGDFGTFTDRHLVEYVPYYAAGTRVDASGSIAATIDQIEAILHDPIDRGTRILRAELHDGFIELGEDIAGRSLVHVLRRLSVRRCVIVTSRRTRARAEEAAEVVREAGIRVELAELPDGEASKAVPEQELLFRRLAPLHLERGDPFVALGDDSLLEAATFSAAVWLRGVPLVTIPVTTLGLIDTSIGGKGGIDLSGFGKNLLGAFHQATATILDVELVSDESAADRRAALAEAVKYGLLGDEGLLALLETRGRFDDARPWPRAMELLELVERCVLAKRRIVLRDERDTDNVRISLNLGHTLSHALEAATDYRLRHGEAVAYGLRAALSIGTSMGITPDAVSGRAERLLRRLDLAQEPLDVSVADVLNYIEADKKRSGGPPRWVLVGPAGTEVHDDVAPSLVESVVTGVLTAAAKPHPLTR